MVTLICDSCSKSFPFSNFNLVADKNDFRGDQIIPSRILMFYCEKCSDLERIKKIWPVDRTGFPKYVAHLNIALKGPLSEDQRESICRVNAILEKILSEK